MSYLYMLESKMWVDKEVSEGSILWTGNDNGNEDDEGGVEFDGDGGDDYLDDDDNNDDKEDDLVESEYEISDGVSGIRVIPIIEVKDNVQE